MKALLSFSLLLALALSAAEPSQETFLDPDHAGADYKDQGEYHNDWGGVQVIALGHDKFRMVTYPGGLPGDGWNQETRTENSGQRMGEKVVFTGQDDFRAELADGKLSISSAQGGPWTMEKIARHSPTLGAKPPSDAKVLFEGADASAWEGGHLDSRGLLAAGGLSKQKFGSFKAHLEFMTPFKPTARGQERGNSGVYLQNRYEIQVLDSFGLRGEDNECGGIYSQAKPAVNMCYPPLTWQTYDIDFTAAQFDSNGQKSQNARLTLRHNGTIIHDNLELKGATPGGSKESPADGPLQLQGHGNPVFYRNIWVQPK